MSTFDWPDALVPQSCSMPLRKAGLQFQSPFNGAVQAVDFVAERWVLSANLAQMSSRNPRGVGALLNQLAGGVNRVRAWPFHTKGVPRGTLRGTPTLGTAAARGDTTLTLAGCTGTNLLQYSSFEIDADVNSVGDGWQVGSSDGARTHTVSRVPTLGAVHGTKTQYVRIDSVTSGADSFLITTNPNRPTIAPSTVYTVSAYIRSGTTATYLLVRVYKTSGSDDYTVFVGVPAATTMQRVSVTFTSAADAINADIMVRGITTVSQYLEVDAVQVERGSSASPYLGPATLLADDYIGVGGQLFQVAADCTANDAGAMTVPLVNRVRGTIASGSAVTWHKPTAEFIMPAMQAGPVFRPGAIEGTALDLVEVW